MSSSTLCIINLSGALQGEFEAHKKAEHVSLTFQGDKEAIQHVSVTMVPLLDYF